MKYRNLWIHRLSALVVLLTCAGCSTVTPGAPPPVGRNEPPVPIKESSVDNREATNATSAKTDQDMPTPTLGGTQFWTDQYFFHQWRIQRRAQSDEYRLLDEHDWQHANGTFEQCKAKLDQIRRARNLPPMHGDAVVLLHGLAAPRWSMHLLGKYLHKHAGLEVFNVEYASTRCTLDEHGRSLARVISSLEGIGTIHMVGHSMGNIVIRRYLAGDNTPNDGWQPDQRVGRIVMIAPPNHGSRTATRWSDNGLFKAVFGRSARQLGIEWKTVEPKLAIPKTEFGIIAGGLGNKTGFSWSLPGDDDGRITVETTKLDGAADFILVPMLHELLANDPRVLKYTLSFIQHGWFVSADKRHRLPETAAGK